MLIDKEYPATHSMFTNWYFVDESDEVAIFEIEDNGPVPRGVQEDLSAGELIYDYPRIEESGMKRLNLTDEQVQHMFEDLWQEKIDKRASWYDVVLQIDVAREKEFLEYLQRIRKWRTGKYKYKDEVSEESFVPICLSKKFGIYLVDIGTWKYGKKNRHVRFLFQNRM